MVKFSIHHIMGAAILIITVFIYFISESAIFLKNTIARWVQITIYTGLQKQTRYSNTRIRMLYI